MGIYSKFNSIQFEIISEITKSTILLGAKSDLTGTVASWGDTQTDAEILISLKSWNKWKENELKERLNSDSTNN
tara:strand:+ start:2372 stop:2593 length:222 start_codon:yes stop_codon:yes gene_type:complete